MKKIRGVLVVFFVMIFGCVLLAYRSGNELNGVVAREIECDFYSKDAMYYSPGSAKEVIRKACEKKYYGYEDGVKKRIFNLGGVDFEVDGDFGFVLHSDRVLADPKSYRGAADIYVYKSLQGMNGVVDYSGEGEGVKSINIEIGYIDRDVDGVAGPPPLEWDVVRKNEEAGVTEYIMWDSTGWGGMTYVMKMSDGHDLILSCTHGFGDKEPNECIASRRILPRYSISYKIRWSVINNWESFDAAVLDFVFGMMRKGL